MDRVLSKDNKVIAITVAICTVLQLAIAPNINIGGARPDFLLIAVVVVGVLKGSRTGCMTGAVAGVLYDLSGTGPMGAALIVLPLVGFIVGAIARGLLLESWPMTVAVLALCALASELLFAIMMALTGNNPAFLQSLYLIVAPSALYDTVFALICFPLVKHFIAPMSERLSNNTQLR